METLIRPTRTDEGRHLDLLERRLLLAPITVDQRMALDVGKKILGHDEFLVPAALHAVLPPDRDEAGLGDAALGDEFAIKIADAFPRHDGFQMRRAQRRDAPLRHREIGDAGQRDATIAPALCGGPFDEIVVILGVLVAEHAGAAFGFMHAAYIGLHHGITGTHPIERIGGLETGVARDLDIAEAHAGEPHEEIPDSVGQLVLAVRRHRHHHRHAFALGRAEDIGAELRAVTHRHDDVALEADAGGAKLAVVHGAMRLAGSISCSMSPCCRITMTQNCSPCGFTGTWRPDGIFSVAAASGGSLVWAAMAERTAAALAGLPMKVMASA